MDNARLQGVERKLARRAFHEWGVFRPSGSCEPLLNAGRPGRSYFSERPFSRDLMEGTASSVEVDATISERERDKVY